MPPTRPVTGRLPNSGPSRVIRACSARRFDQEPSDDSSNSKSKRRGVSQSLNSLRQDLSKRQQEKLRQEGAAQRMKDMNDLTVRARIALNELAYDNAGEASADDWKEVPLGMTFPGEDDDEEVDYVTEYSVERVEATYNVIVDAVRGAYYITSVPRVTRRDRKHRLAKLAASWEHQIEDLSATYLQWKHRDQEIGLPNVEESSFWEVKLISWARYLPHQRIPLLHDSTVNNPINQLAQLGFLSSSPLRPTLAFSFETLETFRLLSNRCPRLSKQAFVKALCDSHQRLYSSTLRQQFSDIFDTYLSILRCVDRHVNISLSRDAPDWRIRHSCPACQNRLEVEGDLEYTIKLSLDGNNSLK